MSSTIKAESPLVQAPPSSASITESALLGYINLRGVVGAADSAFCIAIKNVTGLTPSSVPNIVTRNDDYALYWLGPDEYLLVTTADQQAEVISALELALDGVLSSVVDVSSGYCLLRLMGGYAQDLLAKGCPLDLDADVFRVGECAQTLVAKANVLLSPLSQQEGYELIARRSYADYLQRWLNQMNNGY